MKNWVKGNIEGVIIKKLIKHLDGRGFLTETFRIDEINIEPLMSYVSYTEPEISRGPHEHERQTDIFSFIGPSNFLIKLWDNRKDSMTYGNYMVIYGGEDNHITVVVPPGVVHGYKNISRIKQGMVINYPDQLFMGWHKKETIDEIRHENTVDSPFIMED